MKKHHNFKKIYKSGINSEVYKNTPHDKKVEKPIEDIIDALGEIKKDGNDIEAVEKNKEKIEKGIDEIVKMALENMAKKEQEKKNFMLALKNMNGRSY